MAPKADEKKKAQKAPAPAEKKPRAEKILPPSKDGSSAVDKNKKKSVETYKMYIVKVLKQVHPDLGISDEAMGTMNSFINEIFEILARESSKLAGYNMRRTITNREIQTAVRLLFPAELAKNAVSQGTKAVTKFTTP
ncbi:hypothetical protein MKW98_019846 [Papaver atlanticum]|uniref:Core Histone H2A/H2B/H3 domain-containing protein n=1 Tax=Papaver atlanticum TaxID=357466 RepID=A0AAD4S1A5_9MAGN|nr:hypothetical protein MKW98_019846 [Papaver atlanticum]